jgi:hypothetical protein
MVACTYHLKGLAGFWGFSSIESKEENGKVIRGHGCDGKKK